MAHAVRTYHGPGPAVQQPWMPPVAVPVYPPMHHVMPQSYGAPWAQAPPPIPQPVPTRPPPTQYPAPMPQAHLSQPLLSQPHMTQISQPLAPITATTPTAPTPQPTTAIVTLPVQQLPAQGDTLEQKKKERDKREKERKEREMRKQREMEMQKKEGHKQHVVVKEPKSFNLLKAPSEFLCKMQFRNNLPDIPFDPKLLVLPQDPMRYTKCIIGSSLESSYKYSIFTEPDLGIPINLIDTNIYKIPSNIIRKMDPEDQALLDATVASVPRKGAPGTPASEKRPRPSVSWLIKTKYLCNEEDLPQFKAKGVESAPSNYKLQRAGVQSRDFNTPEGQIRAVEDTFEAAKRIPAHPTNPALHPVEILPVFPDFDLWPNAYTEVVFDSDPVSTLSQERIEAMDEEDKAYLRSNAIVRGIKGQQLVAFIVPTATRKRAREELTEEDEEYEQVNAFHFEVAKDADLKDNYFFVFKKEGVFYNELATRVRLRKVQSKEEKAQLLSIPKPSSVHVACEEMLEEAKVERDERVAELLQPASADDSADM